MTGFKWKLNDDDTFEIIQGEERLLTIRLMDANLSPVDLTGAKVKAQFARADGAGTLDRGSENLASVLSSALTLASAAIPLPGHGLANDDVVQVLTSGTLPEPLVASTDYFVQVLDQDTIALSNEPSYGYTEPPEAIALTSVGAGFLTIDFAPLVVTAEALGKFTVELSEAASSILKVGQKQTIEIEYVIASVTRIVQLTKVLTVVEQAL